MGGSTGALPPVEHVRGDAKSQKGWEEWRAWEKGPRWGWSPGGREEEAGTGEWTRGPSRRNKEIRGVIE